MASGFGSASGSNPAPSCSTPSTPSSWVPGTRPAGARDPTWKYGVRGHVPGTVVCSECKNTYHGGINRLKYHLAGIPQRDAKPCEKPKEEIRREMLALLSIAEERKMQRERAKKAIAAAIASGHAHAHGQTQEHEAEHMEIESDEEGDIGIVGSLRGPRIRVHSTATAVLSSRPPVSSSSTSTRVPVPPPPSSSRNPQSFFVPRNTPGAQVSLEATGWNKEVHQHAESACADFWYFNNIPFNVASSPYWHNMVTALTVAGKGFKPPSRKDLSGRLLTNATQRAMQVVEQQKVKWKKYGCSILSDGWTDGRNRTIINFLVACKGEVVFWKSIDASNRIKTADTLCTLLEEVVMEVGIANVVQVITDNAAAYVAAGRMLEIRHPSLFWSPCAAHCLDLLLEDIGKLVWVAPIVDDARSITKFIYNHPWVLSLMRDHTQGKELVRPGATRFATIFITLQSILDSLGFLKQMFVSQAWNDSSYSKKPEGERVAAIVFDHLFAQKATEIVKVSEPLVRVLRLVDGDQNPMGYIYEAMDRAKEAIKSYYMGNSLKFDPIWEIVDRRWNNQLHQPIHAAGYFLNPYYFFSESFSDPNGEVMEGLMTCFQRMESEVAARDHIVMELDMYREATGNLFSSEMALRGRNTLPPEVWWKNWGGKTPHLQKIALRVLCQPCSASSCERNWSLFESIHTKKRNKLAQKRLNDLVFVQYNLRLRTKRVEEKSLDPIDLDEIDPYSDWTGRDEQPPLFSADEILDFERQAMEDVGASGDVGLEDIPEPEPQTQPSMPQPEPQTQPSMPAEEPVAVAVAPRVQSPPPPPRTRGRARGPTPSSLAAARLGKRKA